MLESYPKVQKAVALFNFRFLGATFEQLKRVPRKYFGGLYFETTGIGDYTISQPVSWYNVIVTAYFMV